MKKHPIPPELRIALLYSVFGVSWILFSDRLLHALVDNTFMLSTAQTLKGVAFVFLSALLIYLLLHWELLRRRQAEEELQANELLFSKLFTSSPVAISMVAVPTGKNVEVNDAWCTLTGYTKEEVLGRDTVELNIFTSDERNRLTQEFSKHGFANLVESEITTKNVAKKNILITSEITVRHGQQLVLVSAFDITERKQAETALRLENERFQAFVNSNIVGIVIADATGRIITANDYYLNVLGVTRADFEAGRVDWRKATPPEWLPADEQALRELDATGLCEPYEKEYVRTDGTRIPVYLADAKLPGPSGQIAAFVLDITARKQAEQALRESEALFTTIFQASPIGINLFRVADGRSVLINDAFLEVIGYSRAEVEGHSAAELNLFVDPEYRTQWMQKLKQGEPVFNQDARIRTKTGRIKDTLASLELIELHGETLVLVVMTEITERRNFERALAESEASLKRSQAVAHVGHWIWDTRTNTVHWSDEMQRLFGLDPETVHGDLGLIIENAIHPEDRARVRALNESVIRDGQPQSAEYRVIHSDGSIHHLWAEPGESLKDEHGRVIQLSGIVQDITARKQAEVALRLQSSALNAVANAIVITDRQGVIEWCNPAFSQLTGYTVEEALGKNPRDLLKSGKHDRSFYQQLWETVLSGQIWSGEIINRRKDGREYYEEQTITPLHDEHGAISHFIAIKQDITARKQAEGKIQRQLAYLTALREIDLAINSSSDMRVSLSILVNRAITLLKVDAAAVLLVDAAQNRLNFAAGQGFRSAAVEAASLRLGESYAGQAVREQRLVHLSDLRRERVNLLLTGPLKAEDFMGYSGLPLIAKGRVIGVLELFDRAVVERDSEWFDFFATLAGQAALAIHNAQLFESLQRTNAELEMRVADRTAELNKANRELERANQIKAEFLATMSHELRTPLNAVLGLSETLLEQQRGRLNTYQSRSISTIYASGQHLLELINDVLDLSKIEAGKFDYYPQVMEVESLCRASLAFVKESALRKAITLHYQAELPVPRIYADPRRLKQILVNLLTNAVKFTPEGGEVTLQVEQEVENDHIRFAVTDTGIGIASEDLKRLFQPFMQVDSRLTREYEGTGLGLALVQRLTDLHGGSVHVESEVNKGSCFAIHLMMGQMLVAQHSAPTLAGKPDNKTAVSIAPAAQPLERGAILLAEDNMSNVLMVGDYLEGHGYTVHVAHDGAEALAMAQAEPHDLILMDIQMPVMNGLETIQRLRRDAHFDSTPIIALTALAMPGDRERCLEAGANEYLSKPVALKSLLQTVRVFVNAGRKIDGTA